VSDADALLRELLVAWRATYDPTLEALIARLGAQIARARGPLEAANPTELENLWARTARAGDPSDVDRLTSTRQARRWKGMRNRVELLEPLPPDPRIATALATMAQRYRQPELQAAIAKVLVAYPTADVVRTPANPALLERAHAAIAPSADLETLWRQHHAQPDDLQHRMVLADALQQANDPRGEFIAAQMAMADGVTQKALRLRADALLHANLHAWMGRMPWRGKPSVVFERGFLKSLRTAMPAPQLLAAAGLPQWATVEDLILEDYNATEDLSPLVRAIPSLRRLVAPIATLAALAKGGPHEQIEVIEATGADYVPAKGAFPNLRVLAGRYDLDARRRLISILRELQDRTPVLVVCGVAVDAIGTLLELRGMGPAELRLTGGWSALRPHDYAVRIQREAKTADVRWYRGQYVEPNLTGVLRELANRGLTIRLQLPASFVDHKSLARELENLAITFDGELDLLGYDDD